MTTRGYQRIVDLRVSTTDPDATIMLHKDGSHLGYQTHYVVDGGKSRIILGVLVTPAEVMENQPMLDLIWRALPVETVAPAGHRGYQIWDRRQPGGN